MYSVAKSDERYMLLLILKLERMPSVMDSHCEETEMFFDKSVITNDRSVKGIKSEM